MKRILLVAAGVLGLACGTAGGQEKIVIDGSTTVGPIAKAFAEYYMSKNHNVNITVSESGSGNGAKSLINGTCDIADMSRYLKDTEFKAAAEKGIMPVAFTVAVDGIAVIVHPSNPLKGLTVEQLRDIYTGKISKWSDVGGPDKAIVRVSRDTNSGTYESFETLVMNKQKMAAETEYVGSNGAMRAKVQESPLAIGYVGLGFADETTKTLAIESIVPDRGTVSSGKYPISRPLFMFTNGFPKMGSPLYGFVTLYLSKKGQEIVESIGFVPVTEY